MKTWDCFYVWGILFMAVFPYGPLATPPRPTPLALKEVVGSQRLVEPGQNKPDARDHLLRCTKADVATKTWRPFTSRPA